MSIQNKLINVLFCVLGGAGGGGGGWGKGKGRVVVVRID